MRRGASALAALSDEIAEAVIAVRGRRVTTINRAAAEMLGITPERAAGRSLIEVVVSHRLERLALHGGEEELDYRGRTLRARGVPGGLILEDVSEQRRRERDLRETGAVLSHEFRTPVAAISSLLEAIESDPPAEERQRFARIAAGEAQRLTRLLEDLTQEFRPTLTRRFPLGEATARVRQVLSRTYPEPTERLRVQGDDVMVRCDQDKLVQVLINLVENAFRYGPPGEAVSVCAGQHDDRTVLVSVRDAGAPLADFERIFEGFRGESRRTGPGSGLGLRVVRGIVAGWGGRAWAGRAPDGKGNQFCFTVPAA